MASRGYEIGVGCLLVVAIGVAGFMALQIGAIKAFGTSTIEVTVEMPDAAGISPGASVNVAGVEVGQVTELVVDFDRAKATLSLHPEAQIRKDAKVRVRQRSVLGEKYLELTPQTREAPLVVDGDSLKAAPLQTEIDEMVGAMGPLMASLDPEVVSDVIQRLQKLLEEDPERLARMFENADKTLVNVEAAAQELPALVGELRSTLTKTRGTLDTVNARASEARGVMTNADQAISEARGAIGTAQKAIEPLPEVVAEIRGAVGDAREMVGSMEESTENIKIILENLKGIDKWELRRLLREEGILIRLSPAEVEEGVSPTKPGNKRKK